MKPGSLIILNTIVLYIKMAVSIGVSLFSVRIVLSSLGAVDYGIFNVIMGVIAMLSFLNGALTTSTQRYLSFYQGQNNTKTLISIFNHSLFLHAILGIIIVLLLEIGGTYFIDSYLQIPYERLETAKTVFQFAIIAVFFTFISVPYTASINANEQMIFIAIISILESLGKLFIAILITYIAFEDKLLIYGIGMGCISIFSFLLYYIICNWKYPECKHIDFTNFNKKLLKDMGIFASWNLVGSFTAISKSQGIAVLLNMFKGPAINAAYAVANQVSSQLNYFSVTMIRSINPQIMKAEGSGNRKRMIYMSLCACKYGFLLLAFFSIPCLFEMETILNLWLKDIPEYSVVFCKFVLLAMMFDQLTVGINSSFQACNLVKISSIYVGAVKILILPLGYFLLSLNFSVVSVIILYAFVELFAGFVRLYIASHFLNISLMDYSRNVLCRIFQPVLFSIIACSLTSYYLPPTLNFIFTFITSIIVFLIMTYLFSLTFDEKNYVKQTAFKIKTKWIK